MALALSDIVASTTTPAVFTDTATRTFNLPTSGVSEGMMMVLIACINQASADIGDVLTDPSGWNEAFTQGLPNTASTPRFYVYWREVPGGGLGSTVDITSSVTNISHGGVAFAVQNADTSALDVVGTANTGTGTTITCPAVTASGTGGLTIRVGCNDDDDQSSQPSMSGHSAVDFVQVGPTVQNGFNLYVWAATQPSTSVSTSTASISNEQWGGQTLVIAESAGSDVNVNTNVDALTLTENQALAQMAPRVWLNTSQTKSGAAEMTVTAWDTDGTSITFSDPAGAPTGSLYLGVEDTRTGGVGWIAVTVSSGDTNVAAGVDSLTLTEQAASVGLNVDIAANVDALTLSEFASTITYDVDVQTNLDALTLTEQAATIVYDVGVSANVDALTLSEYQASVANDFNVTTNVDALTLTTHQASLGSAIEVLANTDALTLSEQAASVSLDVDIAAGVDVLTLTEFPSDVDLDIGVAQQAPVSGGWGWGFVYDYNQELESREREEADRERRRAEAEKAESETDREIARLLHAREADEAREAEIRRLEKFSREYKAETARRHYGERVAKAYARAATQGNYSSLEALDRELKRAREEEDFLLMASVMILNVH